MNYDKYMDDSTEIIQIISNFNRQFDQIRVFDPSGNEKIRVNLLEDNTSVVVEKEALQNKQDRYYFKESLQAGKEDVYVSHLDLNFEHGQIQMPYNPVIRVGRTVHYNNELVGSVIITLKRKIYLIY